MKHIKAHWLFVRGHWEFTFTVDSVRDYKYETWDGLVAQDIIRAIELQKTGHALNVAKMFCTRTDRLQLAARQPNMVQPELPLSSTPIDTEAETQPIIARARVERPRDAMGICPECGAIGYGDGNCLRCKVQVCREGTDNGRHVQR